MNTRANVSMVGAFGAAAAALAVGVAGCGSDDASPSPATSVASTSAAATPLSTDYTSLLLRPSDIDAGWELKTAKPEAGGVTGVFGNSAGTEKVSSAIVVRESSATAAAAVAAAKDAIARKAAGAAFSSVDVGTGGGILDGPGATTVVAFSEGRAFAILEFNSKSGERVPADVAIEIARKQDAAIKAGVR
ncbi:MAG: hypothetical protein HOQ24_09670 [Mycobacteriaceae bacterium]|nr:hypothetical protein [Mycobacteriaceae bacterium]